LEYLKPGPNNKVFLIKGKTTINNIDLKRTLWERSTQWWENEIVIKDDTNIDILDIKELTMDKYLKESNNKLKENVNPIMDLINEFGIMAAMKFTGLTYKEIESKTNLTRDYKIQFLKDLIVSLSDDEDEISLEYWLDQPITYKIDDDGQHILERIQVVDDEDLILTIYVYDMDEYGEMRDLNFLYNMENEDITDDGLDTIIEHLI